MNYNIVSDFLINPVLRQARRFSRSTPAEQADTVATPLDLPRVDNAAIADIVEGLESLPGLGQEEDVSGPEVLEAEVAVVEDVQHPSPPLTSSASARGIRISSLLPEARQGNDDVSDNPSSGFPGRFRTNSTEMISHSEDPSRLSTFDQNGLNTHHKDCPLPEDDGMGDLRHQIIIIQSLDVPSGQKARLMHELLTKGYSRAQEVYHTKHQPEVSTQAGMISQERPTTPGSLSSFIWQMNGTQGPTSADQQHTFHLSPNDLKPTYAPVDPPEVDDEGDVNTQEEELVLGCRHYKRNVKLQCATCDRWYTCRLCHDEAEAHILNRKATKNMLCMICGCAQRASEFCVGCGERTAWYYCGVCKLWDNDANKSIYHCNDCGICRKGRGLGKDFFHCKVCTPTMLTSFANF
jgi:uncharacterized CHY-type Zn-finger protein